MAHPYYYNVRPRYTPGSGAMVDEATARRVVVEERRFYEIALEGAWGEEDLKKARELGLRGIVECIHERAGGFDVLDLLTNERSWRGSVKPGKIRIGDRILHLGVNVKTAPVKFRKERGQITYGMYHSGKDQPNYFTEHNYVTFDANELVKIQRDVENPDSFNEEF